MQIHPGHSITTARRSLRPVATFILLSVTARSIDLACVSERAYAGTWIWTHLPHIARQLCSCLDMFPLRFLDRIDDNKYVYSVYLLITMWICRSETCRKPIRFLVEFAKRFAEIVAIASLTELVLCDFELDSVAISQFGAVPGWANDYLSGRSDQSSSGRSLWLTLIAGMIRGVVENYPSLICLCIIIWHRSVRTKCCISGCHSCGYELSGTKGANCPECGKIRAQGSPLK